DLERALEHLLDRRRVAGLGDEFPGAERARVAGVGGIVLAGEYEDLHRRGVGEQVGDQLEALVGAVRRGRQAEVDQRKRGRGGQLAQQRDRGGARLAGLHLEILAERESERRGDERIIVDYQQRGPR